MREGDMEFIRRKIFESQYRKVLLGTVRGLRKFPVGEENNRQDGGNSNFRKTVFVSYYRKVHWELFDVSEIFWQRKLLKNARRDTAFFRRAIFVSQYREISLGTLRCFKKFRLAKKLHGRERERGIPRFSVALFLCHSFGNLHWEPFVVSEHF